MRHALYCLGSCRCWTARPNRRILRRRWRSDDNYPRPTRIDEWFRSIVKDADFYETQGQPDPENGQRCYFYNIDLHGRLFLEETLPKNIATSIKDNRFLNFFFQRIRPVPEDLVKFMEARNIPGKEDYPFVSPCGKELNFIRPAASPIVFHRLENVTTTEDYHGGLAYQKQQHLVYGGDLTQPFDWQNLAVSPVTGRLYHAVHSKRNTGIEYGLVRSQIAIELVDQMHLGEKGDLAVQCDDGRLWPVKYLDPQFEPGKWGMPNDIRED